MSLLLPAFVALIFASAVAAVHRPVSCTVEKPPLNLPVPASSSLRAEWRRQDNSSAGLAGVPEVNEFSHLWIRGSSRLALQGPIFMEREGRSCGCNRVQGAAASVAFTAMAAIWNLQLTESKRSCGVRIPPSPPLTRSRSFVSVRVVFRHAASRLRLATSGHESLNPETFGHACSCQFGWSSGTPRLASGSPRAGTNPSVPETFAHARSWRFGWSSGTPRLAPARRERARIPPLHASCLGRGYRIQFSDCT